jgi:hypothetical protein
MGLQGSWKTVMLSGIRICKYTLQCAVSEYTCSDIKEKLFQR